MRRYIYQILCTLSMLINSILGGAYAQTLSARLAFNRETSGICRGLCHFLDFVDRDHSLNSMLFDLRIRDAITRAQRKPESDPHVS